MIEIYKTKQLRKIKSPIKLQFQEKNQYKN